MNLVEIVDKEDIEEEIQFDDDASSNHSSDDIPKEERKLITQAYDKSIDDLVKMIQEGDIKLNPDYQRNYIWDTKKSSLLVESILLNVPIPVIYVVQEADYTWTVIDGLQRLNSLNRFFIGDFKLKGLEILDDLNGVDIHQLKSNFTKAYRMLKNGLIRVIMVSNDSHPEIKYDIFMRLNRGSVKLNEQELRNVLYRGGFNEELKKMPSNEYFLKMLNRKAPHNRFTDVELIIRFFAMYESWDFDKLSFKIDELTQNSSYKGNMKSFLNEFLRKKQKIELKEINQYKSLFQETIEKVYETLGKDSFKRINIKGEYESINRALIDCIMVSFANVDKSLLIDNKSAIREKLNKIIREDINFRDSITLATSDKDALTYRLKTWSIALKEIVNESSKATT